MKFNLGNYVAVYYGANLEIGRVVGTANDIGMVSISYPNGEKHEIHWDSIRLAKAAEIRKYHDDLKFFTKFSDAKKCATAPVKNLAKTMVLIKDARRGEAKQLSDFAKRPVYWGEEIIGAEYSG